MIDRFVLYPYKVSSESAHALKDALKEAGEKAIIVYPDRNYTCQPGDFVIGWGNSKEPKWSHTISKATKLFNHWGKVAWSVDKEKAFAAFKTVGVPIPAVTTSVLTAFGWHAKGFPVIGRTLVKSMQGKGISLFFPDKEYEDSQFTECKLFTKFVPDTEEFRVYVFNGKVIDVLEKRRANGSNDPGYVRSEENGWRYCRQHVSLSDNAQQVAIEAVKALDLDFAGVDLLVSAERDVYVLETNACPEIFGTGVKIFRDQFITIKKEYNNALQSV